MLLPRGSLRPRDLHRMEADMEAIHSLRRHGFLWLNVHGITATGEYQVRFPLQLRHLILPDPFDTPGDEITDLDSNVHPWREFEFAAALRQGGFDVAD